MSFIVAIHVDQGKKIVSIIDSKIIGKVFEEGKLILKLDEPFYQGTEKSEGELIPTLLDAYFAHFTGDESVQFALDNEIVDPDRVITIQGIPHAEALIDANFEDEEDQE